MCASFPQSGRTTVPRKDELLIQLARANQFAWMWVFVELCCVAGASMLVDWATALQEPIVSLVAVGMIVGPTGMSILRLWVQKKKEIGELKESTSFGQFNKHRLRSLYKDTVRRLGLPDENLPVYITADKSLNASAVRLGLLGFFKSMNGIYLNRQVLHRLEPEEVQDIMGHELGHYYKYYLVNQRFTSLTILLGAILGLLIGQWTGMSSFFSVIVSAAGASLLFKLDGFLWSRNGMAIEYLCDDLGAQVCGLATSVNGLLKLGVDAEMQLEIQQQTLLSKKAGNLSPRAIMEAVEKALPYGQTSPQELDDAIQRSLKERAHYENQKSLTGFLDYAWNSDNQEDIDEQIDMQMKAFRALHALPRLEWEALLSNPVEVAFQDYEIAALVALIKENPDKVLFRLPQEAGLVADVHPPLRERILFLAENH